MMTVKFSIAQQRRWCGQWKDEYNQEQEKDAGHRYCFLSLTGTQTKFSALEDAGVHLNLTLVCQKSPIVATGDCFENGTQVCSVVTIVHKNHSYDS